MKTLAVLTLAAVAATGAYAQERGRVLSSTPITQQVAVPQQVCSDQPVAVAPRPTGAGAVVGAIAGGLIGNAIGGGGGRAAATAAGVVGGAMLGNQAEASGPVQYQNMRQCSTQTFYQNRTVGYNVTYEYNGRSYTTQTANPPGQWIALNVQPVANDPVYSNDGYYSTQTPPQGAYSTSYPQNYDSGYYAPQPVAPTYSVGSTYSASDYVAPLLIGAAIGAGAYYATRPGHYYRPGYRPGWHGGHGWRR
ncbi:glycine zipper 2TM domain-containing protein [Comamonas sp. Tr-654]|uniref:glycine zipper 2TM domain-containing protein n=1 Tax=Comamonas sp. Tr-654 TaxID=2608341 RepID=UPI00142417C5|nr:glycine zipper 2TM domain-containing protein [Comamonas sp. Tr-654]NIF85543.1 glycine zipper 2TM domain-containing protein [Comamonas sp. Tr-654]